MEHNHENLDTNYQQDGNLFGQFPSAFFDDIPQNHQQHMTTTTSNTANEPPPFSPPKTKRGRKKRSAGKTDRHSKIHTAQGLRDRRMRLSLHIARKFFGLQDMLGFDKASKTIEWLFCKSKNAIDEVTESHVKIKKTTQSASRENIKSCDHDNDHDHQSPISDCDIDSGIEFDATSNKGKQPTESDLIAKELRDKARARARARTREKKKSKQAFQANPNDEFDQQQLGFSSNPNNNYREGSSSSPLEYSGTHHFFDPTHMNNIVPQRTEDYLGTTSATSSTYFPGYDYNKNLENPPAGWLNSSNTFLGFLGGWDSESFTENYGVFPNLATFTGDHDIHGQQYYSSVLIPPSNLVHYQTQNQRD